MGSAASSSSSPSARGENAPFRNGGPSVPYDAAFGCFCAVVSNSSVDREGTVQSTTLTSRPGFLYRLANDTAQQWYFYNDTKMYDFIVTGYFGPRNDIRPLGPARMYREVPSGLLIVELQIGPLETLPFMEGDTADGYDLKFSAVPRGGRSARDRTTAVAPPSCASLSAPSCSAAMIGTGSTTGSSPLMTANCESTQRSSPSRSLESPARANAAAGTADSLTPRTPSAGRVPDMSPGETTQLPAQVSVV